MSTSATAQLANPLATDWMEWIPTADGKAFKPLRFDSDGWSELMRLEPGALVARHPQDPVHRRDRRPGDYVYEPAGDTDTWQAIGDEPCIVHIKITGAVQYLDDTDTVIDTADAASQCAAYLAWCIQHGQDPAAQILNRSHALTREVQ